jgi:hypothetical protein
MKVRLVKKIVIKNAAIVNITILLVTTSTRPRFNDRTLGDFMSI